MIFDATDYKAKRVWACDLYQNFWILGQSTADETKYKTFSLGSDYDVAGCGDGNGAPKFRSPLLPPDTWFVDIQSAGMYALAIDNRGDCWEFGGHRQGNSQDTPFFKKVTEESEERNSSCYKLVWFEQKSKKVVKIRSGKAWGLILCQDEETK